MNLAPIPTCLHAQAWNECAKCADSEIMWRCPKRSTSLCSLDHKFEKTTARPGYPGPGSFSFPVAYSESRIVRQSSKWYDDGVLKTSSDIIIVVANMPGQLAPVARCQCGVWQILGI